MQREPEYNDKWQEWEKAYKSEVAVRQMGGEGGYRGRDIYIDKYTDKCRQTYTDRLSVI
jgi:hypothetical protein